MRLTRNASFLAVILLAGFVPPARPDEGKEVKETALDAPLSVKVKVRMEGPYTADVPLQVVCYFKYAPDGAKRMTAAPAELDNRLAGLIPSLPHPRHFPAAPP